MPNGPVFPNRWAGAEEVVAEQARAEAAEASLAGALVYNAKTYGATGNGVTDDTAAVQAAMTEAGGKGGVVLLPPGVYLCRQLYIPNGVTLLGSGPVATTVKLKAGTADNLLSTKEFPGGIVLTNFQVSGITFDGNAAENATPESIEHGHCLALRSYRYTLSNVVCQNATRYGVYSSGFVASHTEQGAFIHDVVCHANHRGGIWWEGPSESFISNLLTIGTEGLHIGILTGATESTWVNCRSVGYQEIAILLEGAVKESFVGCKAEGGLHGSLVVESPRLQWLGGYISNAGEELADMISFREHAAEKPIDIKMIGFRATYEGAGTFASLNIEKLGDYAQIIGAIDHEPAHEVVKGAWPEHAEAHIQIKGGTTASVHKIAGRHAAIAEPAETLAGLKAAINELRETVKNGGLSN